MSYLLLFFTFFKIGLFTFGGGYAMLPLIQAEVVNHNWVNLSEFIDFIAVSESTPGPFAINMATYVGIVSKDVLNTNAFLGSLVTTLGVVVPSFIVILIVASFYEKFKNSKIVSGCMTGLKPAVIGLIGSAVITIGKTVFFQNGVSLDVFTSLSFYVSLVLFLAMTFLALKKVNPILIIVISAVVGIVFGYMVGI